jgi:hypothetical protein
MGWRGIRQPHVEGIILDTRDEPLPTLGASALMFRPIIESEHQRCARGAPLADGLPPLSEAIHQAVAGALRGPSVHKQFIQRGEAEAHGGHCRLRGKGVVGSLDRDPACPGPSDGANVDGRFGIHRDAPDLVCHIGGVGKLGDLREDRVGCRDFCCGCLCATCFGESPRALRVLVIVCPVGRASSV